MKSHGNWLSTEREPPLGAGFAAHMNSLLLAADIGNSKALYTPGTVYKVLKESGFEEAFGVNMDTLKLICFGGRENQRDAWNNGVRCVLIEISPACDVAQNKRISASLIAGLIIPQNLPTIKKAEYLTKMSPFKVRWALDDFSEQDAILVFCHNYKTTIPHSKKRLWMKPWFRLRELPTTSIRNANTAHAARVGYISVR
jgi:hypothetical protein